MHRNEVIAAYRMPRRLATGTLGPDEATFVVGDVRGAVTALRLEHRPGGRRKTRLV
jgi:hypothetical protein